MYSTIQKQIFSYMITTNQFKSLDDIYNFYNEKLFKGKLPQCIINLSRKANSAGFFAPERWKGEKDGDIRHEISINPDYMDRPDIDWHSTLVHEMCHLFQNEFGNPSRSGYHNQEFANIMERVGLITTTTGDKSGKRVGQSMTHFILPDGVFENVFLDLVTDENYKSRLFYKPNSFLVPVVTGGDDGEEEGEEGEEEKEAEKKKKSKIKYTCSCGFNVWGKPGLSVRCNVCEADFIEQE